MMKKLLAGLVLTALGTVVAVTSWAQPPEGPRGNGAPVRTDLLRRRPIR